MGIRNPHNGIYSNRAESINAQFNKMKTQGIKSMPEVMITAHSLQRQQYREIRSGYHQVGNKQVTLRKEHLKRPIVTCPKFKDRKLDDVTRAVFQDAAYRKIEDIPIEATIPMESVTPQEELMADRIIEQAEWYSENTNAKFIHDARLKGWIVAGHMMDVSDEQYITKYNSCTCKTGPPCVHWYVTRDLGLDSPLTREALVDMIRMKIAEENKDKSTRGRRPRDLGSKTPSKRGQEEAIYNAITPSKRRREPTIDETLARNRSVSRQRSLSRPRASPRSIVTPTQSKTPLRPILTPTHSRTQQQSTRFPAAKRSISFQMDNQAQSNVPDNLQATVTDLLLPVIDETQADGYVLVSPEQMRNFEIVVAQTPVAVDNHPPDHSQQQPATMTTPLVAQTPVAVDNHPPDHSQQQPATMTTPQTSRVFTIPEENIKGRKLWTYDVDKCISAMQSNPNARLPVLEHQMSKYLGRGTVQEALVKRDDGNKATIMLYGNQNDKPELTLIAANLLRDGRKFGFDLKQKKHKSYVEVKYKVTQEKNFVAEAETYRHQNIKDILGNTTRIQMNCVCNYPSVQDAPVFNALDIQCASCKDGFHSKCFDANKTKPNEVFHCPPCNISNLTKGAVWSEVNEENKRIRNTCPIDGALTQLIIHDQSTGTNLADFFPQNARHDALKEAMHHLRQKDSYSAQKAMHDMMQKENHHWTTTEEYAELMQKRKDIQEQNKQIETTNKFKKPDQRKKLNALPNIYMPYPDLRTNDMFGDPYTFWVDTVIDGARLQYEQNCDNCLLRALPEFKKPTVRDVQLINLRKDETVSEAIQNLFKVQVRKNSCPDRACAEDCAKKKIDSTQTYGALQSTSENQWLIIVDISSIPTDREQDLFKEIYECTIPKALILDDTVYKLGHATFNKGNTHFVSWHYDSKSNKMVYYDSIGPKDKESSRFRIASMSDVQNLKPATMMYFRTNLKADQINDI